MSTLILFDIDGTLVLTGGAGGRAMVQAAHEVFGLHEALGDIPMAGRTDAWIVAQMAALHGRACDAACLRRFHDAYVPRLAREVHEPGPRKGVLPGVRHLLDALASRNDAYLALLTGNFRSGAEIKLRHFGLWDYFGAGAFGDASMDRNALFEMALASVAEAGGPDVAPSDVVVIGDTPFDVAVAVAGGARSIGVATGGHAASELHGSGATVVLEDLSDVAAVLRALDLDS